MEYLKYFLLTFVPRISVQVFNWWRFFIVSGISLNLLSYKYRSSRLLLCQIDLGKWSRLLPPTHKTFNSLRSSKMSGKSDSLLFIIFKYCNWWRFLKVCFSWPSSGLYTKIWAVANCNESEPLQLKHCWCYFKISPI